MLKCNKICIQGSHLNGVIQLAVLTTYIPYYLHISIHSASSVTVENIADIEMLLTSK